MLVLVSVLMLVVIVLNVIIVIVVVTLVLEVLVVTVTSVLVVTSLFVFGLLLEVVHKLILRVLDVITRLSLLVNAVLHGVGRRNHVHVHVLRRILLSELGHLLIILIENHLVLRSFISGILVAVHFTLGNVRANRGSANEKLLNLSIIKTRFHNGIANLFAGHHKVGTLSLGLVR